MKYKREVTHMPGKKKPEKKKPEQKREY